MRKKRFYYDEESKQTIDFMVLMMTAGRDYNSKIRGRMSETYCGECGKYVRIYVILEAEEYENPIETIREGIHKSHEALLAEINELIEIKKREEYTVGMDSDSYIIRFSETDYRYYKYFKPVNIGRAFDEAAKKYGLEVVKGGDYEPPVFKNINDAIISAKMDFHEDIGSRINHLSEEYEKSMDSIYIILDERDRYEREMDYWGYDGDKPHYYDSLEKIHCPDCGSEINKWLNYEMDCPNCDFPLIRNSFEAD